MYNPTYYYVRVSRGGELHRHWSFFTGTDLASYHDTRVPETKDNANGVKGMPEGLPPRNTLLRASREGAWLPAPLLQPLVRSSWREGGR